MNIFTLLLIDLPLSFLTRKDPALRELHSASIRQELKSQRSSRDPNGRSRTPRYGRVYVPHTEQFGPQGYLYGRRD